MEQLRHGLMSGAEESKLSTAWESVTAALLLTTAIAVGRTEAYICTGAIKNVGTFEVLSINWMSNEEYGLICVWRVYEKHLPPMYDSLSDTVSGPY
jgi:hypothetical protein